MIVWLAGLLTTRRRAALVVVAAVLLVHGLGLGLLPHAPGPGWQPDAMRPLQVRRLAPVTATALAGPTAARPAGPPALPEADTDTPAAPPAAARDAAVRTVSPQPSVAPIGALTAATALALAPLATPAAMNAGTAATVVPTDPAVEPELEAMSDAGGLRVPVYATQLPPAVTLRYQLRRGPASGVAELRWAPSATGYQLALDGDLPRQRVIAWASNGMLDAHGIAPERFAESRRGRELRAANFQRDAGRITFSGPQLQHPLLPGAQDRLSWLLQLPAVLAANPALAEPGAQVAMLVAGSRGTADVWTFAVIGTETVALPDGDAVTGAIHLRREPQRPYDTLADVWLDPARHHLPVRLQLRLRAGGDGTELLLLQPLPASARP